MLISGVSRFSFDNFGLTVLKNFVRNPFKLPEIFEYRFFLCIRTENHVLHSKFFVSQYAKNSWERLLRFKMFRISETFFAYHGFPSIFLAHSSEKLREEPSNVSESFKWQVSKNLIKKNGISPLSVEIFCLRVPINFVEEHFFISEKFGYPKISYLRGWYHLSPLNLCHIYCLQKWLGNPSVIQDFWDIENFYAQ